MRLVLTRDADAFARSAGDFLAASVERNILATVLLRAQGRTGGAGVFVYGVDADRDPLIAWEQAFAIELGMADRSLAAQAVDARMAGAGQFSWDDGGPVSKLGVAPEIAGSYGSGPCTPPPEHRRRGYAGSAVAAACQAAIDGGADRCMLFTDVANPTSNKIYAAVGFRPSGAWEDHRFEQL